MDVIQPIAAIIALMGLLGIVLLVLMTRGTDSVRLPGVSRSASRRLEVVERVSLGPQHALHLVRAGGRLLLVATAPNSCHLLDHSVSGEEKAL